MDLPSRERCMQLLEEHNLTEGMVAHSLKVTEIADYLAKKLDEAGEKINPELVNRAALLHDIAKFKHLDDDVRHHQAGYEILKGEFPEIAEIVKRHALDMILEKGAFRCWEDKVVWYADKRVNHDMLASLEERFKYLLGRYGSGSKGVKDVIELCRKPAFELEREIMGKAGIEPELEALG